VLDCDDIYSVFFERKKKLVRLDSPHFDPSGFAASAIFTAEPSMMESDGSRITVSSDVKPDNTSTLLP